MYLLTYLLKVYIWRATKCGLRAPDAQSEIHYNLTRKLCNAYVTTKILSWLWLPRHKRPRNSVPARISNNRSLEWSR